MNNYTSSTFKRKENKHQLFNQTHLKFTYDSLFKSKLNPSRIKKKLLISSNLEEE